MTNIIPFKKPKKKTTAKKTTEREFAFFDKFEELDKAWHKNEKTFTDIFNTYKEHEKKYWYEALRIYKIHHKQIKKISTKAEFKKMTKEDVAKYEKAFTKQNGAFYRFLTSIKKLDR